MKSWAEHFGSTWPADPDTVRRADDYVRYCLARNRDVPLAVRQHVAPCSVEALVADIRAFAFDHRWFWVTAASCLLAELLLGAKRGGIFELDQRRGGKDPGVKALHSLRNAVFHPAHSSKGAGAGEPHIAKLIDHLRGNLRDDLASELERSWAFLAARPVAVFALEMLNAAPRAHPDTMHLFG